MTSRMVQAKRLLWESGMSCGSIELSNKQRGRTQFHLCVTNNSVHWACYAFQSDAEAEAYKIADDFTLNARAIDRLEAKWEQPIKWAKREIAKREREGTLLIGEVISRDAQQIQTQMTKHLDVGQPITYSGFNFKMPHTMDMVHKVMNAVVNECADKWGGWMPRDAICSVFSDQRIMGLSFNPGGQRYEIALNRRLLKDYNIHSIGRVIAHEWCHHYRNQTWPITGNPHDAYFCQALELVDPYVKGNKDACIGFIDAPDPAIAIQKVEKKGAAIVTKDAGYMTVTHLKSGHFTLQWKPHKGFKWPAYKARLNDLSLSAILNKFNHADAKKTKVYWLPRKGRDVSRSIPYAWSAREHAQEATTPDGKAALVTNLYDAAYSFIQAFSLQQGWEWLKQ